MVQHTSDKNNMIDILIVGAGPTGLTAAAEAVRLGLSVRIIDRKSERGSEVDSRALVVHPRVMELLKPIGDGAIVKAILSESFSIKNFNFMLGSDEKSREKVQVPFHSADLGDTEFKPSPWIPQYRTERVIEAYLKTVDIHVEWSTSISSYTESEIESLVNTTVVQNRGEEKEEEEIKSRFVLGCDGGRSKTRELADIQMDRTATKIFMCAAEIKVENTNKEFLPVDDITIFLNSHGTFACFPINKNDGNRFRAFMMLPDHPDISVEKIITDDFIHDRFKTVTGRDDKFEILHKALFNISHGVADKFWNGGRVFLAGDAAHVHSPLGGQGMNYGMQDVLNLVWKLALVKRMQVATCGDAAKDSDGINNTISKILNSYQVERRALAKELIQKSSSGSGVILTKNLVVRWFRDYMVRNWASYMMLDKGGARTISQLTTEYDPSSSFLLHSGWGSNNTFSIADPGARLPNLHLSDGTRLYEKVCRARFTLVRLNDRDTNEAMPGTHLFSGKIISVKAGDKQDIFPAIDTKALIAPQILIIRPDLHVAAVSCSIKDALNRLECLLGPDAAKYL